MTISELTMGPFFLSPVDNLSFKFPLNKHWEYLGYRYFIFLLIDYVNLLYCSPSLKYALKIYYVINTCGGGGGGGGGKKTFF